MCVCVCWAEGGALGVVLSRVSRVDGREGGGGGGGVIRAVSYACYLLLACCLYVLQTDARAEVRGDAQQPTTKYKSLAERVDEFQNTVPRRFHSKPTNNVRFVQQCGQTSCAWLTRAASFSRTCPPHQLRRRRS